MQISDFQLERYFAKYEFKAPYLLCCSDCQSFSIKDILHLEPGSEDNYQNLELGYTESQGNYELRQAISSLYTDIDPDHILVHSGAEETIFNFMNVSLNKGDHVIIHYPCYQSLFEIAKSIGCEITLWETNENDHWELDINFLEQNISSKTKAVIINCPHNPTGYLMSEDKFNAIVQLSQYHGFLIFSDEVYRFLEYDERTRLPSLGEMDDRGVSIGVMSKSFGLAGLRIGWTVTKNKKLHDRLACFKDYTTICNSAPSEYLANIALKNYKYIIERNKKIIENNLKTLDNFFRRHENKFQWIPPKAGPIAFPSIKFTTNAETFCQKVLDDTGVLLLPGSVYGNFTNNFRIGFGRTNLPEYLNILDTYLSKGYHI